MKSDAKNLTGIHFGVIIDDALGKTLRNAGVPDEKIPDCNRDFWNHVREGFVSLGQPAENILLQQADGKAGVLIKHAECDKPDTSDLDMDVPEAPIFGPDRAQVRRLGSTKIKNPGWDIPG